MRSKVRSELWVWHRLTVQRAMYSEIGLRHRRTRRDLTPQVDHIVAYQLWLDRLTMRLAELPSEYLQTTDGEPPKGPPGFDTHTEAESFINTLGNCSLLRADFNMSKSKAPLAGFLMDVEEFKIGKYTINGWCAEFGMDTILARPDEATFDELVAAIRARDARIRADLIQFVRGKVTRPGVDDEALS